jgi:signal transduction histidine kinase
MMLKVLFGTAVLLLIFSWFWNPRSGFSGISQLVSRYLLSIGLPFEKWVKSIAELAEIKTNAKEFTLSAMQEMIKLPWISGVKWNAIESDGFIGETTRYESKLGFNDFQLSLYTHWPLTPAMTMHVKLLTQILGEFCEAKRREEALSQHIYMQAVYETGSRLTHDIKNLVQSMSGLCTAAEQSTEQNNEQLIALIRRQLPLLNQRMARTLEKLEAPKVEKNRRLKLNTWWKTLKQNHTQNDIQFIAAEMPNVDIDPDLLDSVTDNLLQNAMEKRKIQRDIAIETTIGNGIDFLIEVRDTGKAVPKEIADQLFKKQINSQNGLGIGLYHASKQALKSGYKLRLFFNKDGDVRFRLSRTQLD